MKRRPVSPFSLSFLDIMFCGFGAVVLLVLILNTDTVRTRNQTFTDLRSEAVKLQEQVLTGQDDLVVVRNSLQATDQALVTTRGDTEEVLRTIRELQAEIASMNAETQASREHIAALSADLKQLDEEKQRLGPEPAAAQGAQVHRISGEGDRQYLTGLKVGGKRILILLDASASMLDETIINVVRRRNMDESRRIKAPKWLRALATTEWLVSQLPAGAQFQLYVFDTEARATAAASKGKWLSTSSPGDIQAALGPLKTLAPQGGTGLYAAFSVAKQLSPKPDNILLVTDGLPTQGRDKPKSTTVSPEQRLEHFDQAVKNLPAGVPVNTILLPMEGDAWAAAAYWRLALDTQGSFMSPARDWP
jgi:hypothetical protein